MMESNILLVDDNPGMIQLMGRALAGLGDIRFATSGGGALEQARSWRPDVILLDVQMPGMSGYQVCEAIKADPVLCDTPVIFVTTTSDPAFEIKCLALGAADFIAKPISAPMLTARVRAQLKVKHHTDGLRRSAMIDALTKVSNRCAFDVALEREWKRAVRDAQPISLLMVDIDHFKLFNDGYGHPAGDTCLQAVAEALVGSTFRPADRVARYGGEEFAILLPQTPGEGAENIARRVLDAVGAIRVPHETSPTAQHVTVSVGLGSHDGNGTTWVDGPAELPLAGIQRRTAIDLVCAADKALYAAKNAGRARAWRLDLADLDAPSLARAIAAGQSDLPADAASFA